MNRIQVSPDVVYGHKAGMALTFDAYRPVHPNRAAVVFVNSGGFVSGQFRQYECTGLDRCRFVPSDSLHLEGDPEVIPLLAQVGFQGLLESGFTVFDVRHGGSPCFKLPEMVADVMKAIAFIQENAAELRVDPGRIGVWGGSSGGYLALEAAFAGGGSGPDTRVGARSVAVFYPAGYDLAGDAERFPEVISSLPALQVESAVLDSLSLKHAVSPDDPPCLIVYGSEDFPFITGASESTFAALSRLGVPCRRIVIPDVGHEFRRPDGYVSEAGEQASREVVVWFKETLLSE